MMLSLRFILCAAIYVLESNAVAANISPYADMGKTLAKRRGGTWHPKSDRHHVWQLPQEVDCAVDTTTLKWPYDHLMGMFKGATEPKHPDPGPLCHGGDYYCYMRKSESRGHGVRLDCNRLFDR